MNVIAVGHPNAAGRDAGRGIGFVNPAETGAVAGAGDRALWSSPEHMAQQLLS
jgi:hypothetical protein